MVVYLAALTFTPTTLRIWGTGLHTGGSIEISYHRESRTIPLSVIPSGDPRYDLETLLRATRLVCVVAASEVG